MQNIGDRHPRLAKKELELQRLFDEADRRRKNIISKNGSENATNFDNNLRNQKYLLKPLRSSEDLLRNDKFLQKKKETIQHLQILRLSGSGGSHSCHNLPETNLDDFTLRQSGSSDEVEAPIVCNQNLCFSPETNLSNGCHDNTRLSHPDINVAQGHLNPNFVNSSTSTSSSTSASHVLEEVDSRYCQFFRADTNSLNTNVTTPTTTTTTNTTDSQPATNERSEQNAIPEPGPLPAAEEHDKSRRRSSVFYYPSGSPLVSPKYQGSPVVRIDNKIRAGEADYLMDYSPEGKQPASTAVPPRGKPPLMPMAGPRSRLSSLAGSGAVSVVRLSQPDLAPEAVAITGLVGPATAGVRRRNKQQLLQEQMSKRLSMGDYSTRSLIEWESKLNLEDSEAPQHLSYSDDLNTSDDCKPVVARRQLSSTQSDSVCCGGDEEHVTYGSETDMVLRCSKIDDEEEDDDNTVVCSGTQVSFRLQHSHDDSCQAHRHRKTFWKRSLNDIRGAVRSIAAGLDRHTEHSAGTKRFNVRTPTIQFRSFKKRHGSITSDQLYSVPPFARRHLPPDISGAPARPTNLMPMSCSDSTPNLIAQLDPTFQGKTAAAAAVPGTSNQPQQASRNRSYRLSFIESASTVTARKLAESPQRASPPSLVPRYVQPRRRHHHPHTGPRPPPGSTATSPGSTSYTHPFHSSASHKPRSKSSHRISCAQQ